MLATFPRGFLWERRCSCCWNVSDLWRQPARQLGSERCKQRSRVHRGTARQETAEAGSSVGFARPRFLGVQACWQPGEKVWPAALRRGCPTCPQWDCRKEEDTSRQDLVDGWGRESSSRKGGCGNRDRNTVRAETVCSCVLN